MIASDTPMIQAPDLAALLSNPVLAATVPLDQVPALLAQVAAEQARLDVLKSVLAARLAVMSNGHPAPPTSEAAPLTQEEAAEQYRIPLRKLRFLTRTRRLPSYQQGRNRMIRPVDLDRYLAGCRAQGAKVGTILDGCAIREV